MKKCSDAFQVCWDPEWSLYCKFSSVCVWKSFNIWWSYDKNSVVYFFDSQCMVSVLRFWSCSLQVAEIDQSSGNDDWKSVRWPFCQNEVTHDTALRVGHVATTFQHHTKHISDTSTNSNICAKTTQKLTIKSACREKSHLLKGCKITQKIQ